MSTRFPAPELRGPLTAVGATITLFGVSFGVLAIEAGFSPVQATLMSALVLAGASQFAAIGALATGATATAAWLAAVAVAVRYLPLGLAAGPAVRRQGVLAALRDTHLLTDQTVAIGSRPGGIDLHRYRWTGAVMVVTWVVGTGLASLAASGLPDPAALGLDAAYPALFLAMLAEQLRGDRRARASALAGGLVALTALFVVPAGVAVALASLGVLAAAATAPQPRRGRR